MALRPHLSMGLPFFRCKGEFETPVRLRQERSENDISWRYCNRLRVRLE